MFIVGQGRMLMEPKRAPNIPLGLAIIAHWDLYLKLKNNNLALQEKISLRSPHQTLGRKGDKAYWLLGRREKRARLWTSKEEKRANVGEQGGED